MENLYDQHSNIQSQGVATKTETATARTAPLNKPRHVKYWLRCLKTHLPNAYQSNDSQRLSLAFFILCALDLLDELHNHITEEERQGYVDWIYRFQHPSGGFRGFEAQSDDEKAVIDEDERVRGYGNGFDRRYNPANLGATFFALEALVILRDDLSRVRRSECLQWLQALQKENGSFGEMLGEEGPVEGDDVRLCYLAAGVRWFLREDALGEPSQQGIEVPDIDLDGVVGYIRQSMTFEGGIAKAPFHEANAGETFCGVGALGLLGRLPATRQARQKASLSPEQTLDEGIIFRIVRWLLYRQTACSTEDEDEDESENQSTTREHDSGPSQPDSSTTGFHVQGSRPAGTNHPEPPMGGYPSRVLSSAGFTGRCNKMADTCYAWWAGGTLAILRKTHLQDFNAAERYLLEKTQHLIGGFGKAPGDPPDILHSCLGLAALAAMRHPDLKAIDPALCISVDARDRFRDANR